jgi:hypothetical protein
LFVSQVKLFLLHALVESLGDLTQAFGEPIEEQLDLMKQVPEVIWQQFNFESTKPIAWENIKLISLNG